MKRILSFLLALTLAFSMIPGVFVQAEQYEIDFDDLKIEDFAYEVINNEATITGYSGLGGNIMVPSELEGYPVVALSDYLFNWNTSLTAVLIPDSVTSLGEGCFEGCENLVSVILPKGLKELPQDVFLSCSSLKTIELPENLTTIGFRAFRFCTQLETITIPASVTQIENLAFDNCNMLDGVWVDAANANYCTDAKGVLFNKAKTTLIWAPQALTGLYEIPETVQVISQSAFEYNQMEAVTIPNSVKTIERDAFNGCEYLMSVTIPDSVTTLSYRAFANNDSLKQLILGAGAKELPEAVFYGNPELTSVSIPEGVTTIGPAAFAGCPKLGLVRIPVSVTTIADYAFAVPALADVYYAGTQEQWSAIAIGEENLFADATFHFADDVQFAYEVKNDSVTITGYTGAAADVVVPGELGGYPVVAIGTGAFRNRNDITSVVLPDSIVTIGADAFWDCRKLKSINIPNGVTTIGDWAFYRCESLQTVTIPNSVTALGDYAFQMCWSLESITIPGSVQQMYEGVFSDCINLQTVTIEDGVKTICTGMFSACKALKTITIPTSVTAIKYTAFASCDSLTDVYYKGTKAQWDAITIGEGNSSLDSATIHCTGHSHSYTKKVTKPTCTAKGYTTYTCSCGDTYKDNYTKALGHTYKSGKCTRCGYKPAGAKITTQPVNVAVKNGKTAKVTIKATGDGLKYTWYYAKKGSSKFTKTSVTSTSYSVKMSNSVNGGKVYCVVTDKYGNSVKSSTVTLYKGTPAKITTQPKGITVGDGKTGKLEIKASGSSLKYQWYVKYKGATAFTKVGKSSKTYSFKMAAKLNGAQAYCVVKDKYGIEVKSSVVTIKQAAKPKVTTQPVSVLQVSGKTVKFSVKATGEGLKYQWYYAKKGSNSFKKLSGATKATYSVKVSKSVNGRKYYCLVTDKYGQTVKSSAATLTLKTVAKITTQPKNVTVKSGKTAKFTVKAVGDGLKYTWYYGYPASEWEYLASGTNTISIKANKGLDGCLFRCVVTDRYGNTVISKTVTLKVKGTTSDGDPDNDDTNGKTVYITPTGKRYHIDPQCGGKNSTRTTLGKAKKAGLTPCKTCVK